MNLIREIGIQLMPNAQPPRYATSGAAGADLYAYLPTVRRWTLYPGATMAIPTGVMLELPDHLEAQIRPRSGLALNAGLTVLNSPGTVDSDYRGEIKVILHNTSNKEVFIQHGDRIAQMVIAPVIRGVFTIRESFSKTERGSGGFGSTGTA